MTQHAVFTRRATNDCRRYGVDEDEARYVLDHAQHELEEPDPGDPNTVFHYSIGQLPDGRWIEVTWEQLADQRRVRRVCELPANPEDWSD